MKNIFDLSGRVAVVTGGAGLIGREIVRGLAQSGATAYIADNDRIKGKEVYQELVGEGLDVRFVILDISEETSVIACLQEVVQNSGYIDIWVNNAYPKTKDWGLPFEKIPFTSWRENIDKHLNGYCLCCQKVGEQMKKKEEGSIINIASIYGMVGPDFTIYEGTDMGVPAAYSVIKGAIVNFTRYLASYYGKDGIRVNTISSGGVFDNQPEKFVKNYSRKVPLKRMASPEDIAGAVIYLASDASLYVTGHNLVVDGGWSII